MKDAIQQFEGARTRYKEAWRGIGEPVVPIPLEYLSVVNRAAPQVFISLKDLTKLVSSVLSG